MSVPSATTPRKEPAAPERPGRPALPHHLIDARARAVATAIVLLGALMASLSGASVSAAYPVLAAALGASPASIAWVGIANFLVSASLLTIFGRLADLHGRKRLYALGTLIYVAGSVLCATSTDVWVLVLWRVVQAVGSALIMANSVAYLIEIYPPNRRGALVGWWEACIAVGQGAGPVIGGLVLAALGWPAVFLLNLPFGLLMLALLPRYMIEPRRPASTGAQRFDWLGAGLLGPGVALLLFGFTEVADLGWGAPAIWASLALGGLVVAAFLGVEARVAEPMVDLRLFRSRGFAAGNLAKVVAYLAFGAHTFLLPFYMYRGLGLTPETLGWTLTPLPIGMLVASLTFGPLSDRIGTRLLAAAGLLVVACSAVLLAGVQPEQGLTPAVVSMALAGLGIGAFIAPNDSAILAVTPRGKVGVANGIMGVSRSLGLALGQSVAAGLLAAGLAAGGEPALVPSFHQVYLVVALLGLLGAGLASVRDTPRPRPTPGA